MVEKLDRRLHAYRCDLADIALKGRIERARYVEGEAYHVHATIAPMYARPDADNDLETQALFGEEVRVFEIDGGFAWCQLAGDGYVGYLPAGMLSRGDARTTHTVIAAQTLCYRAPSARAQAVRTLPFGAGLDVAGERDDFLELRDGSFVGKRHVDEAGRRAPDFVGTARRFLGAPYLWGGKSVLGIDCSGLVQLALMGAGITCPRDTDMQAAALPGDVAAGPGILSELQAGDLVYWPQHVGIMVDAEMVLHANGTAMSTTIDPVGDVAERSRKGGPAVTAVKRLK